MNSRGVTPKSCLIAADAAVFFILADDDGGGTPRTLAGDTSIDTTTTAQLRAEFPLQIATHGFSHFMFYGEAGTEVVTITPLED